MAIEMATVKWFSQTRGLGQVIVDKTGEEVFLYRSQGRKMVDPKNFGPNLERPPQKDERVKIERFPDQNNRAKVWGLA